MRVRACAAILDRFRSRAIVATATFFLVASALAVGPAPVGSTAEASSGSRPRLTAPAGLCAGEDISSTQQRPGAIRAMVCLTNFARQRRGLPRFQMDDRLSDSASSKAADILRCNAFSHTACGRPFTWAMNKEYISGASCWRAGENIARGMKCLAPHGRSSRHG